MILSKYSCWVGDTKKARECLLKLNGQARWNMSLLSFHKLKMSKFQPVSKTSLYYIRLFSHMNCLQNISDARLFAGMQTVLCKLFLHGRKKL